MATCPRVTPSPACGPKPMLFAARRFPFGGRRPGPPRPAPDGAGPRLEKAPVAVHPLPQGGGGLEFLHSPFAPLGEGAGGHRR
jgi:hypothetical protein